MPTTRRPGIRAVFSRRQAAAALMAAAIIAGVAACGSPGRHPAPQPAQPNGAGVTAGPGGLPSSALGPDACQVPATSGAGPWRMILRAQPLCGLPYDGIKSTVEQYRAKLGVDALNFNPDLSGYGAIGKPSQGWVAGWETPNGLGTYRTISVDGFTGQFIPERAMKAFAGLADGTYAFKPADPGPHGGVMECGQSTSPAAGVGDAQCVFATTSTIGIIKVTDTKNELTSPGRIDQVAQEIRDVVEVPAS